MASNEDIQAQTILVVDDEEAVRSVIRMVLERAGYKVLEAGDGETALKLYRENLPDVAVTDLKMDPMGGLEFIDHLLREFPDAKFMIMTAYSDGIADVQRLGPVKTLTKPFFKAELTSVVQDLLGSGE